MYQKDCCAPICFNIILTIFLPKKFCNTILATHWTGDKSFFEGVLNGRGSHPSGRVGLVRRASSSSVTSRERRDNAGRRESGRSIVGPEPGLCDPTSRGLKHRRPRTVLDHRKSTLVRGSRWDYTPLPF